MLTFLVLFGYLLVLLGSVRLLFFSLMSVGHSVGHSSCSWNLLTFLKLLGVPASLFISTWFLQISQLTGNTVLHNEIIQGRLFIGTIDVPESYLSHKWLKYHS